MRSTISVLLFATLVPAASAQQPEREFANQWNAWFMYFGDHPVKSGPWGVHLEGQLRRHGVSKAQQLLLRPAVNYEVNKNFMLTAGYAFVDTHRYGEFPAAARFPEHRLFQQAILKHSGGRVAFQHRYRLEQRFLGEMSTDGDREVERWRHENRFRYMLRSTIPLRGDAIEQKDWYLAFYNELFVNFGKNVGANIFDQNRAYGALGYSAFRSGRVELGYLNQTLQQRNGRFFEVNHTLQVAFYSTLPFGD